MQRYKLFSGDKPTLEDLEFNQNGIEAAILNRHSEMFTNGVVTGLEVVFQDESYSLLPGIAYANGERIVVDESTLLNLEINPQNKQQVCISYKTSTENPKQHFITGEEFDVWIRDDWEIVIHDTSTSIPDSDICLAVLHPDGALQDCRSFVMVKTDQRIHLPNTDTYTSSNQFRVGGPNGDLVLTNENMLTNSSRLRKLFSSGLIDYEDGHGERELLTRKIPSKPNKPVFNTDNIRLKVDELNNRLRNISLALETYTQKQIISQTLESHISKLDEMRSLIIAKQLKGYTLDQIRGDANVGDDPDLEVWRLKNRMIITGTLSNARQSGTLSATQNLSMITGSGTSFSSVLIGKSILIVGLDSEPVEYQVASVQSTTSLTLSSPIIENSASNLPWYLADSAEVGFDGNSTKTITELLAKVDTTVNNKVSDRSARISERDEQAQLLLQEESRTQLYNSENLRRYTLIAEWDKPALVDMEEIVGYQVRVIELDDGLSEVPNTPNIKAFNAGGSYGSLVKSVQDQSTPVRQKTEQIETEEKTASGSTSIRIVYANSESTFHVNSRVKVNGEFRIINEVDTKNKTITLNKALSSSPPVDSAIYAFRITYESDVESERFLMNVLPGKHYVLFIRSISEYGIVSDWTNGVVLRTDDLAITGGKTLSDIITEEGRLKASLQTVQRDQMTSVWNEQLFSMQRVIAGTPTREEFIALQSAAIAASQANSTSAT